MELDRYLEDLESRIDPGVEDELLAEWRSFNEGRFKGPLFRPRRRAAAPSRVSWPTVRINQALQDFDAMVFDQFRYCSETLAGGGAGGGAVMMVRANYGTPIMALPFGAEMFLMPEETNTLPTVHPLGAAGVHAALQRGQPSADHPYLQKVYETGRRLAEIARHYPKIGRYVAIYHPDLQSSMDVCEMVWGSEIFLALVDEPERVHEMLRMVTALYIQVMRRWRQIVPPGFHGMAPHWGFLHRGQIMLREDSAMNLSAEMYAEFIKPYDEQLLAEFGGGAIHACGRVDHFVRFLAAMPGLYGFNMSQPHLNDMEVVWQNTVDRGIDLLGFDSATAEVAVKSGRDLRGHVQVW